MDADALLPLAETRCSFDDGGELWLGNYCHFIAQWTNHPHRHPAHHEFCLVLSGQGEYLHGEQCYPLAPGDLIVSDLNVVHEIRSPKTRDLILVFFSWAPGPAGTATDMGRAFRQAHRVRRSAQDHLATFLPSLQVSSGDEYLDRQRRELTLSAMLQTACAALAIDVDSKAAREALPMHRAQRFIAAHCAELITVADIAAEAGIGERQLLRLFRQRCGCTVVQALQRERLRLSTRLLVMQFPVAECARRVGIASASMFCRLFKQHYGQTPRAWQAEHAPRGWVEMTEFGA